MCIASCVWFLGPNIMIALHWNVPQMLTKIEIDRMAIMCRQRCDDSVKLSNCKKFCECTYIIDISFYKKLKYTFMCGVSITTYFSLILKS